MAKFLFLRLFVRPCALACGSRVWNHPQDCIHAAVTVMGSTLDAKFRMNCSVEPWQLDIEVLPQGSSCGSV